MYLVLDDAIYKRNIEITFFYHNKCDFSRIDVKFCSLEPKWCRSTSLLRSELLDESQSKTQWCGSGSTKFDEYGSGSTPDPGQ